MTDTLPARLPLALLTLGALALPGCGPAPVMATYERDDREESFMQVDYNRYYRVYVPERRELGPAAPLVLALHGVSQTNEQLRAASGLDEAADAHGFIVVYLQAAMGAWDVFGSQREFGLDEVGYVREVIDRVSRRNVIDKRRIIAVGLSNGGVMSQQLACKLSDRIAGFVSVAASLSKPMAADCQPTRPVSAVYILGTADSFFPAAGNAVLHSFDGTLQFWASRNGCEGSRTRMSLPDLSEDGTRVHVSAYRGCDDGSRTVLDSIVGGGHAWPGATLPAPEAFGPTSYDISANEEIVRLLAGLPRD